MSEISNKQDTSTYPIIDAILWPKKVEIKRWYLAIITLPLALLALITTSYLVVIGINSLSDYIFLASGFYISNEIRKAIAVIVLVLLMSTSVVIISEILRKQSTKRKKQISQMLRQNNPQLFNELAHYRHQKRVSDGRS